MTQDARLAIRTCVVTAITIGLVALFGCRHDVRLTEQGAPGYQRLNIRYDLNDAQTVLAMRSPKIVRTVAAERIHNAGWTRASLRIQYPHPAGTPAMGYVELWFAHPDRADESSMTEKVSQAMWIDLLSLEEPSQERVAEVLCNNRLRLDIAKPQLDLLLFDLANSGFFDDQIRPDGKAMIEVKVDRGRTAHRWDAHPRLNELISRVIQEGKPVRRSNHTCKWCRQ